MNFTADILTKNAFIVNFIIRIKDMVDFQCVCCVQNHSAFIHAKKAFHLEI